ncbi:protein fmp52, mitochondrial [Aspergillus desertorum]
MANVALIGCTGMVGSQILNSLIASPAVRRIDTISRRTPQVASSAPQAKLTTIVSTDTSKWASELSSLTPTPSIFISALGTTRAAAGSFENQYKLDHDLNLQMAKAARDAGAKVYVLISSSGADVKSTFAYTRMKGEIEEGVKALGFEKTVILRPGLIAGQREESRPVEAVARFLAGALGKVHSSLKDGWAQGSDVIGKAAVNAGLKALNGEFPAGNEKVWYLYGYDIIQHGKD